jgi:uncharacterized coiled-coil protein SlyX
LEHAAKVIRICEQTKFSRPNYSLLRKILFVMSINERFMTIIRELYNGNKRAFSIAIGVTPTVIEVGTRQGKPSFDVLEKVCANANISAEWLMSGRGEMLANKETLPPQQPIITDERLVTQGVTPDLITELLNRITEQAAEIGRLNEQIRQMQHRLEKDALDAPISGTADVG